MREIVCGVRGVGAGNIYQLNVWFRFPVPAQRQAYYAAMNSGVRPQAPDSAGGNAYSGADAAEVTALQAGQWIERPGFAFIIDPAESNAQIAAHLVSIYNTAATAVGQQDTAALANYASSYDGTSWTLHSF